MKYQIKRRIIFGISIALFLFLYFFKNYSTLLRILTAVAGLISFYVFDHYFKMDFQTKHYSYIAIIIFFTILLSPLYFLSDNYDKILHLINPIMISAIMFFIINKQKISFKWKIMITLMFVIATLAIFEIIEYFLDTLWDFKFQGVYVRDITGLEKFNVVMDKNDDTMIDLIFGIFGSITFSSYKIIKNWKNKREKKKV